jgi:ABC-type nitrate/sulfonate/bicarbonate transport system substrate-binding protein
MVKSFIKKIVGFILVFGLMSVSISCSRTDNASVIRVNILPLFSNAQIQLMKGLKLLEKYFPENMTIEWSSIENGPDIRDALMADKLDIANVSIATFISAIENDLPLVLLSYCGSTPTYLYSKRSDIQSLCDFKETDKIALTTRTSVTHIAFLAKCKKILGDSMALDKALIPIPIAETISSLQNSNDFDGALISFPNTARARDIEDLTKISDLSDVIYQYGIGTVFVTSKSFYDRNPELIKAFYMAQKDALDFLAENPKEAAKILNDTYNVAFDDVLETLLAFPPANVIRGYDKLAELLYEAGILQSRPKPLNELPNYKNLIVGE